MINQNTVLRFKDAAWNISGLFTHDKALLLFYDLMTECGLPVKMSVHGNIPCCWNSGRIIRSVSESYQKRCLEAYAKRNIPVFLTFSNYLITEDQLDDTISNRILKLATAYPNCGIIVGSSLIAHYIRSQYPDLMLSTSILRAVHEHGRGDPDYYTKLAKSYNRVVLHPDDGLNPNIIEQIHPKEKIEVLVNENCIRNCPVREEHCDLVCQFYQNRRSRTCLEELEGFKAKKCQSVQNVKALRHFLNGEIKTCNFNDSELSAVYTLGVKYFKIQGRSLSAASLLYDITRYILQVNYASIIYKMMMDRIGSFVSTQDEQVLDANYINWERI